MAAGDLKADRKLDILSRTIATPAVERTMREITETPSSVAETNERSRLEGTPEADTTVDESFESAFDQSHLPTDGSLITSRMSDPFLVRPKSSAVVPREDDEGMSSETEADESMVQGTGSEVDDDVSR